MAICKCTCLMNCLVHKENSTKCSILLFLLSHGVPLAGIPPVLGSWGSRHGNEVQRHEDEADHRA